MPGCFSVVCFPCPNALSQCPGPKKQGLGSEGKRSKSRSRGCVLHNGHKAGREIPGRPIIVGHEIPGRPKGDHKAGHEIPGRPKGGHKAGYDICRTDLWPSGGRCAALASFCLDYEKCDIAWARSALFMPECFAVVPQGPECGGRGTN